MNSLVFVLLALFSLFPLEAFAEENSKNALEVLKDVEINGFLDTYYSYNFNKPYDRTPAGGGEMTNRFHAFDLEDNSVTVDNFELVISRPSTTSSRAGFTLITNYGEIAQRIVFAKHANYGRRDDDDFCVSVAYVSYLADLGKGVDIKVGRFATWIGAEVWESIGNPNWSRSYLYQNAIPFTNTGVSAGYKFTENLGLTGYVVNGWDSYEENNNDKSLGYRLAYEEKNVSFYVNGIHGNEKDQVRSSDEGKHDTRNLWDLILDLRPTDKLHVNINYDHGVERHTGHWHGISTIVAYDFTDSFGLALRGEYMKDAAVMNSAGIYQTRTGVQQSFLELYETTLTANIRVSDRILVRPEYRHDWAKDKVFDTNSRYSQDMLSCSVAYIF